MSAERRYALIGAGPSGLAGARNLARLGIAFDGFEAADQVGGLWNIDNPRSTVYESAHLISSRTTTQFDEFPMDDSVPDYPGHDQMRRYFADFAREFDLERHFRFGCEVLAVEPVEASEPTQWRVSWIDSDGDTHDQVYDGVILANGTLAEPSIPTFTGEFSGEIMHSSAYKSAEVFTGKRVLIIGAGNSGCDIAVDAVHRAASVQMSVRRGYYFVPKYIFGRPSDTFNQGRPLPRVLKQFLDSRLLKAFVGDPRRFDFPKPDYRIWESHPIVNTLILHHLGQGDVRVRPDVDSFDGKTVHFTDGSSGEYDLILLATGYTLDYPFIDRAHLNWQGMAPKLFLNIFPPAFNDVYVLGMIEGSGIGWQGRYEQAELIARYLKALEQVPDAAEAVRREARGRWPDLTAGYRYLNLERMSYYVNKDAYRRVVGRLRTRLGKALPAIQVDHARRPAMPSTRAADAGSEVTGSANTGSQNTGAPKTESPNTGAAVTDDQAVYVASGGQNR